jgi:hypothetical protein
MRYMPKYDDWDDVYVLVADVFVALAIACFLWAAHRVANGVLLGSRVRSLAEFAEAYTPEEREVLIHKIKHDSLKY